MKKLLAITGALLISCILISSAVTPSDFEAAESSRSGSPSGQAGDEITGYIISSFSGKVALYRKRDNKVLFTTDTMLRDLPKADKEAIEKGIEASSLKEADNILREYCS